MIIVQSLGIPDLDATLRCLSLSLTRLTEVLNAGVHEAVLRDMTLSMMNDSETSKNPLQPPPQVFPLKDSAGHADGGTGQPASRSHTEHRLTQTLQTHTTTTRPHAPAAWSTSLSAYIRDVIEGANIQIFIKLKGYSYTLGGMRLTCAVSGRVSELLVYNTDIQLYEHIMVVYLKCCFINTGQIIGIIHLVEFLFD